MECPRDVSPLRENDSRRLYPVSGSMYATSRSVRRHERLGGGVTRREHGEQIEHRRHLEEAVHRARRADDHELALLAAEQRAGAQDQAHAARIEELQVAEVED